MTKHFIVYYETLDNKFRTYNLKHNTYETIKRLPINISNFSMMRIKNLKLEGNDESLKIYSTLLYKSSKNITKETKRLLNTEFKYIGDKSRIRNHSDSIEAFFNMCCYDVITKEYNYNFFKSHSKDEIELSKMTYNGYMSYTEKGTFDIFEYDVKGFYQHIFNDDKFYLCHSEGHYKSLKKIPEKLYIGYYFVEITCNDDFKKMFMINHKNVYTNYDLMVVRKYQKEFNIQVKFTKETNNAYVYEMKKNCIKSSRIFGKWSLLLDILKTNENLKDNILLKSLSSRLGGNLRRKVYAKMLTEDEVDELNKLNLISYSNETKYKIEDIIITDEGHKYKVFDTEKAYFYKFRLHSFLISYGRMIMSNIIYQIGLNNIIRIVCDGICTIKEFNIFEFNKNNYYQLIEDKKGKYQIGNINEKMIKIENDLKK
jgi:hypothetical protein